MCPSDLTDHNGQKIAIFKYHSKINLIAKKKKDEDFIRVVTITEP